MKPSLLIWDFNGTILDDGPLLVAVNNQLNREHNLPEITYEYYRNYFCHPPQPFYEQMGYDFQKESYAEVSRIFLERYEARQQQAPLMPHIVDVLSWAKSENIPQIILSAHKQDMLEEHLRRLGIAEYFSFISGEQTAVIGSKIGRAQQLRQQNIFDFSHAVLIGDTIHDWESAQAMELPCILYSGGHQSLHHLQSSGAPIIDDLNQLPAFFTERNDLLWKQ